MPPYAKAQGTLATESRVPAEAGRNKRTAKALHAKALIAYLETLVVIVLLVLDVLLHRFFCHRAYRPAEVSSRPQVLTPILLAQLFKLLLQLL